MRVQMLTHITGTRDGAEWPLAGGEIDLPDNEAADLIASGRAKEVDGGEAAAPSDDPAPVEPDADADVEGDDPAPVEPDVAPKPRRGRPPKATA